MYLGCHNTYIQFPSEGTLQIYTWELLRRVCSKREIRIDDTADLAYGHGPFKNNSEDRGMAGVAGVLQLKGQKNFEIALWEERQWRASARFVSLFVSTRVCTRGYIYLKRGWRQRAHHVMPPRKNPRDSAVFCERALRARNFIAARNPTRTISSSTKSRVVYRETAHLDRSACTSRAIPRSS